jgi:hypothetical protein
MDKESSRLGEKFEGLVEKQVLEIKSMIETVPLNWSKNRYFWVLNIRKHFV